MHLNHKRNRDRCFVIGLVLNSAKEGIDFKEVKKNYEINFVRHPLRQTEVNLVNAAATLRINRSTLNLITKRHNTGY